MKNLITLLLVLSFIYVSHTLAQASTVVTVDYRMGIGLERANLALSRFSVSSESRFDLRNNWSAQLDARVEMADDDIGLGTTFNFASINQPLVDNDNFRIEIDRAYVQWRKRAHSFTLGKQVTPWGVLDGIQITDRFDPVRRRDFVFTEVRPDRIARWGVRWRNKLGQLTFDTSLALDETVSQQAELGALFFNTSTRFTGGLDISNTDLQIITEKRGSDLDNASFGIRVSYPIGEGDLSLLSFRGPDKDPILSLPNRQANTQTIAVKLAFMRRTLYGASYDINIGDTVLRAEMAYIPDQAINIIGETPLVKAKSKRLLAGFGIDWNAPASWFINIQLAIDHLDADTFELVRPATDTILTLRAQRGFYNNRLMFKGELLGTINEGDGVLRPELVYEYTDRLKLKGGIDYLFGDDNGQFGQFKDNSRIWLAATYTF